MPAAAIVTLVGVALTVIALAVYLVAVAVLLRRVSFTLGTIVVGLRSIAYQTGPLEDLVADMNRDLEAVRDELDAVAPPETAGRSKRTPFASG